MDIDGPHQERLQKEIKKIDKYTNLQNHMLRLDHCSSEDIKYALAKKDYKSKLEYVKLNFYDSRIIELLYDYPRLMIPLWLRPWVEAKIIEDYPIEYRVFVEQSKIIGVSNYYIQRPLPDNGETKKHINKIFHHTTKLIDSLKDSSFQWSNRAPSYFMKNMRSKNKSSKDIHFTVDFIITQLNEVLLLEGGPPSFLGAHLCCFKDKEIKGIALSL